MASRKKSPQELAAEIIAAFPFYSDYSMPKKEAVFLNKEAQKIKKEVEALRPYLLSDKELSAKLKAIKQSALANGVWSPNKGDGSQNRLAYTVKRNVDFGYIRDEATTNAKKELARDGYAAAIRFDRTEKDKNFKEPIKNFIKNHKISEVEEQFSGKVISLAQLNRKDKSKLQVDFPSGNFLYHGTETEQLIKILESGYLSNAGALYEQETKLAETEGRDTEFIRRNSGYEGISWSLNNVDALPGDRYHLAGLLAAPEVVLGKDEQLAIPSRPAIYEAIQIDGSIDAMKFYEAKTQLELYCDAGTFGEANSVFNNLWAVSCWRKNPRSGVMDKPMLYTSGRKLARRKDCEKKLRELYTIGSDKLIYLSHNLLGQTDDEFPIAAVWLQALIDAGRLEGTVFDGKKLLEIIDLMNSRNTEILLRESKKDWLPFQKALDAIEAEAKHVKVPVENMYLVAAQKDLKNWLKVLARTPYQPKVLLLYDDKKVRLENFATLHRGDHAKLTYELRNTIPAQTGFLPYNEVLGTEFEDIMRAGHHHQIIAERYLSNRGYIRWRNGKLSVER
jgi:hypothetical protein